MVNVIRRLLIAVLVLLGVGCTVGLLYLQYGDLNQHKSGIESQLSQGLGRDVRIAGELDIKLFPAAYIRVEQVSIANAPWGSQPLMARIGLLSAQVRLLSLLAGPLGIEEIIARDVDLLLEADERGHSNWDFNGGDDGVAGKTSAGKGEWRGLTIDHADVSRVTLIQRQPKSPERVLKLDTASVDTDANGLLTVLVEGHALGLPVHLTGQHHPRGDEEKSLPAELTLRGRWGGLKLELDGNKHALGDLGRARLRANLTSAKIESTIAALGVNLPFSGPLLLAAAMEPGSRIKLHGKVNGIEANAAVTAGKRVLAFDGKLAPLDRLGKLFELRSLPPQPLVFSGEAVPRAKVIKLRDIALLLGDNRFSIDGELSRTQKPSKLTFAASGKSLAQLSNKLPELAYESTGEVSLDTGNFSIDKLRANFGDSDLTGSLEVQRRKPVMLRAGLQSTLLDLTPFQAAKAGVSGRAKVSSGDNSGGYVLSDEPLPLDALDGIEANVEVRIKKLLSQQGPWNKVELDADLQGGDLGAQLSFQGGRGGRSANSIHLDTSASPPALELKMHARELRFNLAGGKGDVTDIPPTDMTVRLVSRGDSLHKLAATANGEIIFSQGAGRLPGGLLEKLSSDLLTQLLSAINPMAETEPYTQWDCGVYRLDVVDGSANIAALYAQTKNIKVVGGGSIDFNTEKLNIEFNTKPRKGIGVSADMFVSPFVALKGTLAAPQIGLNQKGALLTSGTALATGGLSLLARAAADRAGGVTDDCQQHLDTFARHTPMPAAGQQ